MEIGYFIIHLKHPPTVNFIKRTEYNQIFVWYGLNWRVRALLALQTGLWYKFLM